MNPLPPSPAIGLIPEIRSMPMSASLDSGTMVSVITARALKELADHSTIYSQPKFVAVMVLELLGPLLEKV